MVIEEANGYVAVRICAAAYVGGHCIAIAIESVGVNAVSDIGFDKP